MDWGSLSRAAQIPPAHRIYVNRNLRMAGVEAIGFDMDHTLALYDQVPFDELAFEETKRKLLKSGYPDELAAVRYDPCFAIRGLVVDKKRGNILKMDEHRYVSKVWHGLAPLPDVKRKKLYQRRSIHLGNGDFIAADAPFSLPEIGLYAAIVDIMDRRRGKSRRRDYYGIYEEVRSAMDTAHADGSIKRHIAQNPDRYLVQDPELPATLDRMKTYGYRLFLLTNSEADYTALIMNRLLSGRLPHRSHWTEFFDVIVVRAGKPRFFRNRASAKPVALRGSAQCPSARGKAITGGGVADLERRLGCAGDRILYFGDHTYGDILKSKRVRFWRTAMVVPELEREIGVLEESSAEIIELKSLFERREQLDFVGDFLDRTSNGHGALPRGMTRRQAARIGAEIAAEIDRLDTKITGLERSWESRHNPHWGPLFRTGRELSHFAAQVRGFACIYTGRVSNFLRYPMNKYFRVHPEWMSHEDLGRP